MLKRSLIVFLAALLAVAAAATAQDIKWISKDELRGLLGNPNVAVIDVRTGRDWDASDSMVKGAVREDPSYVSEWAGKYAKDKRLVFY